MSGTANSPLGVAIVGPRGRVGCRLVALAGESADFHVAATLDRGQCLQADVRPDVLIDFSQPEATRHWLNVCRERRVPMVIGTTALNADEHALIDVAATDIPVLQATNTSLGVAVLVRLVSAAARALGASYDVEILETHHRFKKDAPSGTAETLLKAIVDVRQDGSPSIVHGRQGRDATRQGGEIGVHSLRAGDEVGRHTVHFATLGERLELTHAATSRDTFARGALAAARWLVRRPPGRYAMADVLGLA